MTYDEGFGLDAQTNSIKRIMLLILHLISVFITLKNAVDCDEIIFSGLPNPVSCG